MHKIENLFNFQILAKPQVCAKTDVLVLFYVNINLGLENAKLIKSDPRLNYGTFRVEYLRLFRNSWHCKRVMPKSILVQWKTVVFET